jgi:hypothetical protein
VVELPGMRIEILSMGGVRLRELRARARVGLSGDEVFVAPLESVEREDDAGCTCVESVRRRSVPASGVGNVPRARSRDHLADYRSGMCRWSSWPGPPRAARSTQRSGDTRRCPRVGSIARAARGRRAAQLGASHQPKRIELAVLSAEFNGLPEFRPDDEILIEVLRRLDQSPSFQGIDPLYGTRRGRRGVWCVCLDESAGPPSSRQPGHWRPACAECCLWTTS